MEPTCTHHLFTIFLMKVSIKDSMTPMTIH